MIQLLDNLQGQDSVLIGEPWALVVMIKCNPSRQLEGPPAAFITQTVGQSLLEEVQARCYIRTAHPIMFLKGSVGGRRSAQETGKKVIKDGRDRNQTVVKAAI